MLFFRAADQLISLRFQYRQSKWWINECIELFWVSTHNLVSPLPFAAWDQYLSAGRALRHQTYHPHLPGHCALRPALPVLRGQHHYGDGQPSLGRPAGQRGRFNQHGGGQGGQRPVKERQIRSVHATVRSFHFISHVIIHCANWTFNSCSLLFKNACVLHP